MRPEIYTREHVRRVFSPLDDPNLIIPERRPPARFSSWPTWLVVTLAVLVFGSVAISSALLMWHAGAAPW